MNLRRPKVCRSDCSERQPLPLDPARGPSVHPRRTGALSGVVYVYFRRTNRCGRCGERTKKPRAHVSRVAAIADLIIDLPSSSF